MKDSQNSEISGAAMLMLEMKLLAVNHDNSKNVKRAAQKKAVVRRAIEDHVENKRLAQEIEPYIF